MVNRYLIIVMVLLCASCSHRIRTSRQNLGNAQTLALAIERNPDLVFHRDKWERTLLHWAAHDGLHEAAAVLIEAGADPNAQDNMGNTPLIVAVDGSYASVVKLLIMNGAEVTLPNKRGDLPLHKAASRGCAEVVNTLLAAGSAVAVLNGDGKLPLHYCSSASAAEALLMLEPMPLQEAGMDGQPCTIAEMLESLKCLRSVAVMSTPLLRLSPLLFTWPRWWLEAMLYGGFSPMEQMQKPVTTQG